MNLSISNQLAYSTVRIECTLKTGGFSTGTGFFFHFLEDNVKGQYVPVIVTNKHVIKDSLQGTIVITLKNNKGEPINTEH